MPLLGGMSDQRRFAVVILAAGQGTRMRSDTHKVLHPIAGRPLLLHLLARVDALGADKKVGGVQNINEDNMPEAHIRGDVNTQYKCIGAAIITMQQAGFQRVGFISEPPPLTGYRAE